MALIDTLESIDTRMLLGNSRVYTGSTTPDSPQPGDLWVDGNYLWGCAFSRIGGANVWASEMKVASASFDGIWSTSAPATIRALIPICDNVNGVPLQVILRRLSLAYVMGGTSHSSTNRYEFLAYWRNTSTGAASQLTVSGGGNVAHSSSASVANRSYHIGFNINGIIGGSGNVGCIQMDATRNGSPGGLSGVAVTAFYQLVRPA
jgi:hypothetical protein